MVLFRPLDPINARAPRERSLKREAAHASAARQGMLTREVACTCAVRQPTLAWQGSVRSHTRLPTPARKGSIRSRARVPMLDRGMLHSFARKATRTHAAGTARAREGCSPASRASCARSRARIQAHARHAPGTHTANYLRSRGMFDAVATKANCRRSSDVRQQALATKAHSPRSREEVGRGLHAACSPHSRGKQRRLVRQAAHDRGAGSAHLRAS